MTPRFSSAVFAVATALCAVHVSFGVTMSAGQQEEPTTPFVQWVVQEGFEGNDANTPLVVQDKVIVGTDKGDLLAYRCADGDVEWYHRHADCILHFSTSFERSVQFVLPKLEQQAVYDQMVRDYATTTNPSCIGFAWRRRSF